MAQTAKQEAKQQAIVWSTKAIKLYEEDINNGIERKETPFYFNNPQLRRPNLLFEYTQEEMMELVKCKNDVNYFANHYAYSKSPTTGALEQITLRDYQENLLHTISDNRFTIIVSARQSGKTVSSSIYLAWYALFHYDRTVFLCANKEKTARDVISKVQDVILNVPFFMKPGINKWGSLENKFDNGCRIIGEATTPRSGIGFTIHCLYLDEFAHIEKNIIDEFYSNIYPTVSSLPDSKIIITSTPNGMNKFYEIYNAATKGINSFKPFRIDWWEVPDWDIDNKCWKKRDEKWMEMMIKNLGDGDDELGRERFGAQFGNSFLSTGNLLLGPNALKLIEETKETFVRKDHYIFDEYEIQEAEHFRWKQDVDVENLNNDNNVRLVSVDLSEGNGGDDLVMNIFNMFLMDKEKRKNLLTPSSIHEFVGLEQTGIFSFNNINLLQFSKILYLLSHRVLNPENTRILLEWNAFGGEVFNNLKTVFGNKNNFDQSTILKFKRSMDSEKLEYGLRLNSDNKKIYCQKCKRNIGIGKMVLHDYETIEQFKLFGKMKTSYAAITGHDDMAMTCVDANAFFDTRDFKWLADYVIEKSGLTSDLLAEIGEEDNATSIYGGFFNDTPHVVMPNNPNSYYYNGNFGTSQYNRY